MKYDNVMRVLFLFTLELINMKLSKTFFFFFPPEKEGSPAPDKIRGAVHSCG